MGKDRGILLNRETGDLDIKIARDSRGMITQGIRLGDVTQQNIAIILKAQPGEIKEQPLLGVGIDNMLLDSSALLYKHRIRQQLEIDGLRVDKLNINKSNIEIDANYK